MLLDVLKTAYSNLQHRLKSSTNLTEGDSEWLEKIEEQRKAFQTAMDDDFNTANAISVLFDLAKHANYYLQEKNTAEHVHSGVYYSCLTRSAPCSASPSRNRNFWIKTLKN